MIVTSATPGFVKFANPGDTPMVLCVEDVSTCLPVASMSDLSFQVYVDDLNPEEQAQYFGGTLTFVAQICDCSQVVGDSESYSHEFHTNATSPEEGSPTILLSAKFVSDVVFNTLPEGDCFKICLIKRVDGGGSFQYDIIGCAGCFEKKTDTCYTTLIKYRNRESGLGFDYRGNLVPNPFWDTFYLSVRVPMYLRAPLNPVERTGYMKSNGQFKKLSARVLREWAAKTGYLDREQHEALGVALEFDEVIFTNTDSGLTAQPMYFDESYEPDWPEFMDYPAAIAEFKIKQNGYNLTNTNCL